ncbi:MAG: YdbH domain-containing protein [Saccharospirillaceae bacterium]|nr:YdbH domain-containing protein [Saccharospirillaceae bacterium]
MQIETFSWHQFHLSTLQLPLADGSLIQLTDLDLRYQPAQLLQGRLTTLSLAALHLSLPDESARKVAAVAAHNAGNAAREQLSQLLEIPQFSQWLQLPLERVSIDHIVLQHPAAVAELSASLTPQQWRIHGNAQLDNLPLPWQIELQLQHSGDWLLMVAEQSQLLVQQYGHVEQDTGSTRLTLDQRLDFAALSERLPQLAGLPLPLSQLQLSARLELPNRAYLPQDLSLSLSAGLTTRQRPLADNMHWQSGDWHLTLNKADSAADWQWQLRSEQQRLQLSDVLPNSQQPLTLSSGQQLSGHCNAALSLCEAEGQLQNRLQSADGQQLLAQFNLTPALNWQQGSALSLVLPLDINIRAQTPDLPLQSLHSQGELIVLLDASGDWQLSSIPGISNRLQLTAPEGWQLPPLEFQLLPTLYIHGNLNSENNGSSLHSDALHLTVKPWHIQQGADSFLHLQTSEFSCRPAPGTSLLIALQTVFSGQCDIQLQLAKSRWQGWPIPELSASGPIKLLYSLQDAQQNDTPQQRLNGELQLSGAGNQLQLRMQLQHDLQQQRGSLQWHLDDLALNWDKLNLPEMTALTKLEFLNGALAGQGWIDWQQIDNVWQIKPDLMLRSDHISAVYDNSIGLEQWNALIALRRPFSGDYLLDAQISGKSLNPGIELKDILARSQTRIPADFSYALAEIYEMHTDVLGGRVHTPLIRFDTRKDINAFGIELEHIQLAQIAALEPKSEVEASGTLDGVLPIVLTKEGAQIPGGSLFARAPGGVIRYQNATSEALQQSDQTVGLAMQLLQNFHYDKLQTNIQYQPDGALNLGLQFQGKNPDFFGGQATHLNVNLEYNLLDLLESLRVTQDVISRLEGKYQGTSE